MKHLIGYILIGIPILYVLIVVGVILWDAVKLLLEVFLVPVVFFAILVVMVAVGLYLLR